MIKIYEQVCEVIQKQRKIPMKGCLLRTILCSVLALLILFLPLHEGFAKARKTIEEEPNNKYASMVVDSQTGAIISQSNADKKLHPASLTKVMTLLLLFESIENGNVRLSDRIPISAKAAAQQPSKLGLDEGSSIRVEDAILAVVTKSANDIAVAIAEYLGGSEARFAQSMNSRAQSIGMKSTYFKNASGLHNPAQVTSARDMAIMARYIINRYPNFYAYFGTKQFTYRGKTMSNHNKLMNSYAGMDGFKTGYITQSGFNLIASAKHSNGRIIGVVFGGKTSKSRNDHMAALLDNGFSRLNAVRLAAAKAKTPILKTAAAQEKPAPVPVQTTPQKMAAMASAPQTRPVFKTSVSGLKPQASLQLPQGYTPADQSSSNFTSLSALDNGQKIMVAQNQLQVQNFSDVGAQEMTDGAGATAQQVKMAIDQGDYKEISNTDNRDSKTKRLDAGLMSAALYKGKYKGLEDRKTSRVAQDVLSVNNQNVVSEEISPSQNSNTGIGDWSIQIGAYASRMTTDDALRVAQSKLPSSLAHASRLVVPLETGSGYLFRARLGGMSEEQAKQACQYFRDCLPIAP